MAHRKYRKSHRKSHRKHRKSHRRYSQHGGSCAAMPLNRESFGQRGGMAPIASGDSLLLDQPTMVQAQSWGQVDSINAAQGLARAQSGGRRTRRGRKGRKSRKGRKGARRHQQRGGSYPWSGGGLSDFNGPSTLVPVGTPTYTNSQFDTEGMVNDAYSATRGAQY